MIEAALGPGKEPLEWRGPIELLVGRATSLEVVDADLGGRVHGPSGLGVQRRDVTGRALGLALEQGLASGGRGGVERILRRLRRGNRELVEMERRQLGRDEIGGVAHVAQTRARRYRELVGIVEPRV